MLLSKQISIILENKNNLQVLVNILKTITDEATLIMDEKGIHFRGMDPSHVVLVMVDWSSETFETYNHDKDINIGVLLKELGDILKRSKNEKIQLEVKDNFLHISIGNSIKYNIRTFETESKEAPLPKINYDCKFKFKLNKILNVIDDIRVISDMFNIKLEKDKASFDGKGDSGEANINYDIEKDEELTADETCDCSYSIEYLHPIVSALKGSAEFVTCDVSSNKPIKMTFDMSANGGALITAYVAPRVQN